VKARTNRAIGTEYTSELLGLFTAAWAQLGAERGVLGQRRVVHAQRRGRDEREHVQVRRAGAGIHEFRPTRGLQIEHQIHAIGQQARPQHLVHRSASTWSAEVNTAVMPPS
jgi:hypothetical protein